MSHNTIPVVKMPPELLLPALIVLADETITSTSERRACLARLRPSIPERTIVNAYVMPSLHELELAHGSLAAVELTVSARNAVELYKRREDQLASELIARHLVELDRTRVGLVEFLAARDVPNNDRREVLREFGNTLAAKGERFDNAQLDRLGKWVSYLTYFGVIERSTMDLVIDRRHLDALTSDTAEEEPSPEVSRQMILDAYAAVSAVMRTRLYLPIPLIRTEVGRRMRAKGFLLTNGAVDRLLTAAPGLLANHLVAFSPYSGPARDGLRLADMYAGFISVRPKPTPMVTS